MYTYPKAPRDRRRRRRILTLRNTARVTVILLAVFVAASLLSEFRNPAQGKHGRLYDARTREADVPRVTSVAPVVEQPVEAAKAADPLLLSAAAREQYLDVDARTGPSAEFIAARTDLPRLGGGSLVDVDDDQVSWTPSRPLRKSGNGRLVIAGGPEGVAIQQR